MAQVQNEQVKPQGHTQADDDRRRAAGEAFDERMKEFTADPPRAPRPDPERRRRR